MDCEYQRAGEKFVCVKCGDERTKEVRRNCPGVKQAPRPKPSSFAIVAKNVRICC